jgi:hypothetical protein
MRNRAFGVLAGLVFVLLAGGAEARAQSDDRKFEVGAQFSLLRETRPTSSPTIIPYLALYPDSYTFSSPSPAASPNNPGFGGRVGYNFSSHIGVEGEFNFFPRSNGQRNYLLGTLTIGEARGDPIFTETSVSRAVSEWKTEALFGLKTGGRIDNFGLFAKFRPGLVHFSEVPSGGADTNFAMDLGTVIEFYPSRRTLIRVDLSDLIIRFGEREGTDFNFAPAPGGLSAVTVVPVSVVVRPAQTTHNFRLGVGFGFRF